MTIIQVAQRAAVSVKTVSRVLNDEPYVREELRQRVLEAAKALRFRPRPAARSLAGSRSYVIAYLMTDPSVPYTGQAQLGALAACRRAGYHLLVESVDPSADDLAAELEGLFTTLVVDGMLLTPPHVDNPVILDALDAAGIGYVRIAPGGDLERSASVDADDRRAAHAMTSHLLDLGHRRIAFITGPPAHGASRRRQDGFRQAMAERDAPVDEALVREGAFTFPSGLEAANDMLTRADRPTAIFASNDVMALGVIATAQRLGLAVPQDLSVAGFDDAPIAAMVWPSLTTVRHPIAEMAAAAADLIIARSARNAGAPGPSHQSMHCELVIRESTAAPDERRRSSAPCHP